MNKKPDLSQCTGEPLINKNATGGCLEDYTEYPNGKKPGYSASTKWVPVSESFKKS